MLDESNSIFVPKQSKSRSRPKTIENRLIGFRLFSLCGKGFRNPAAQPQPLLQNVTDGIVTEFIFFFTVDVTDRKYFDKIWIPERLGLVRIAIARDEAPRSFQVMMERLISRGQSSGRVDDNVESIRKRSAAATRVHRDTRVQADCTQSPDPTSTSALTDAQLVQLSKMALCPQSILRFALCGKPVSLGNQT